MKYVDLTVTDAYCDADVWAYRIGFSVQHTPPQPPQPWFTVEWAIFETIDKVQRAFPNAKIHLCMTDEVNNFRKEIAKTSVYKGGRSLPKPYYWRRIRDFMYDMPEVVVSENEEADDVMSKSLMNNRNGVVVSIDKDLKNTPGKHFNDSTGVFVKVTPAQAYRNFYTQLLTGDDIDNIKGCPNVGKVKAAAILKGCRTPEEFECAVGLAYACSKKVDDPEARMVEMGRLLWMRRKDGELWDLRANGFTTLEVQRG